MQKKVLLILGASSDFGISFIHKEIEKYDYIIAHYYSNEHRMKEIQEKYPEKICLMRADFNNIKDIQRFSDEIKEGIIPNYIIYFPAAKCKLRNFNKIPVDDFRKHIRISVIAVVIIMQSLLPLMAKAHYGKIVFVLTIHTITDGQKYISDYVTAKYALLGLMKSLAMEYRDKGIRINGVSPDTTETKFISNLPVIAVESKINENGSKKLLSVSDIIPTIAYLLDEASDCLSGQNIGLVR